MPPNKKPHLVTKRSVIVLVCLLLLVILTTWQTFRRAIERVSNDFYHPFLDVPVASEKYISDKTILLKNKAQLAFALTRLNDENKQLKAENELLSNIQKENAIYREMMKFPKSPAYKQIFADITNRSYRNWNELFVVNKGSKDGVVPGSLVVGFEYDKDFGKTQMGVVGRISQVTKDTALVVTILSQQCKISVMLPESRVIGILEGAGLSRDFMMAKITWLPKDLTYKLNEKVLTSAIRTVNKPQFDIRSAVVSPLIVGTIVDYYGDGNAAILRNDLYKEAYVKPVVNIECLRQILILNRENKDAD